VTPRHPAGERLPAVDRAPRVLVVIPTYDERANLEGVVARLRAAMPAADVLVVDDASPDGTGELAEEMRRADPRVHVLHGSGKGGLGAAYLRGFAWAAERDYDVLVEMDADGSHPPETLPEMVGILVGEESLPYLGLVIGSRWVPGGEVVDWPRSREVLSRGGNLYARSALGVPVRDLTAGFRAYRADVVAQLDLQDVDSRGYCFQIDMAVRVADAGWPIAEVPIVFRERQAGESKMSRAIVLEAIAKVTVWGVQRRLAGLRRGRARLGRRVRPGAARRRPTGSAGEGSRTPTPQGTRS
jgi:dolichol-phosphate mannosyltransferase